MPIIVWFIVAALISLIASGIYMMAGVPGFLAYVFLTILALRLFKII